MGATREESDESLFSAYLAGDACAHEELFRRYQEPLLRHFERMLVDRAAAEDVVIETFLRLHRHRHRFRPGTPVRPWLFTIARNFARNRMPANRLRRLLGANLTNATAAAPVPESDPEIRSRVVAAFAALPARQREVCSLRLVGEFHLEEIATMTGASLGTVKSRLFYGLRRLRLLLR